jgi:hypothetical protein
MTNKLLMRHFSASWHLGPIRPFALNREWRQTYTTAKQHSLPRGLACSCAQSGPRPVVSPGRHLRTDGAGAGFARPDDRKPLLTSLPLERQLRSSCKIYREVVAMRAITEHQSEFLIPFGRRVSADFRIACLWSALGLTLTGLFFALGFGAEFGQILVMAG